MANKSLFLSTGVDYRPSAVRKNAIRYTIDLNYMWSSSLQWIYGYLFIYLLLFYYHCKSQMDTYCAETACRISWWRYSENFRLEFYLHLVQTLKCEFHKLLNLVFSLDFRLNDTSYWNTFRVHHDFYCIFAVNENITRLNGMFFLYYNKFLIGWWVHWLYQDVILIRKITIILLFL